MVRADYPPTGRRCLSESPVGLVSGYMLRRLLPGGVDVRPVNPRYDEVSAANRLSSREEGRRHSEAAGYTWALNPDGSETHVPDPNVSDEERRVLVRQEALTRQLEREAWARHPDDERPECCAPFRRHDAARGDL